MVVGRQTAYIELTLNIGVDALFCPSTATPYLTVPQHHDVCTVFFGQVCHGCFTFCSRKTCLAETRHFVNNEDDGMHAPLISHCCRKHTARASSFKSQQRPPLTGH